MAEYVAGELIGYLEVTRTLKSMGYIPGLNMFPMPYDFRHDSYHTDAAN
jgi:hypothetical protein